jgi:hypothetical protein
MDVGSGTGVSIGVVARVVIGAGVRARTVVLLEFVQVRMFKFGCSSWGVQVGLICAFLGFHSLME